MSAPRGVTSQMANEVDRSAQREQPPSLAGLPWNNPAVTYTPAHYTRRNLLQDWLLQSNEYHRRRVRAVIEFSRDLLMQLGQNQDDDDLILYMISKDRIHDAWIDIFLTTPDCYLQMAPADVQEVYHEQVKAMSSGVKINEYILGRPRKRKASETENGVQVLHTANAVNNAEGQVPEYSGKRPHHEIPPLADESQSQDHLSLPSETLLSACSSQELDRILDMFMPALSARVAIPTHDPITYAPEPVLNAMAVATAVVVAPPSQPVIPVAIPPTGVAPQPGLADPIAAYMASNPSRNTQDIAGQGCAGIAMSRGQIRAFVEIQGRPLASLPPAANSHHRHELRGVAPPKTIDPTLINCVTTAQEILTVSLLLRSEERSLILDQFLPFQTVNYELWDRIRKSWAPKAIADFIAYVRQLRSGKSFHRTTFHHYHDNRPEDIPEHTFTTNVPSNMSPRGKLDKDARIWPLHDYFLYHLGDGVVHYPAGRNAQLMTHCVWHVRNVSHDMDVKMSEIVQYAAKHGISVPAADLIQPDTNVVLEDTPSPAFLAMIHNNFVSNSNIAQTRASDIMNQNNYLANSAASPSGGSSYTLSHTVSHGGDNSAQVQDYQASDELTRNGLRAEAAFNTPMVQLIIKDFCDLSERLERIGAMAPTQSGLQYWVRDSANGRGIIVAECVELLRYAPGYTVRVPRDVRLAFEALNTPELVNQAMYHSLSGYLRYLAAQQPALALQAYQPPPPPILLERQNQIVVPQGPRTSGVRSSGSAGIHRYEWPESRKLAWLCITPRMVLPEKALESSYCSFNSVALWDHVDVRLIGPNIEVTLVEIAAVGYSIPPPCAQNELTKDAVLSSSSLMLEGYLEALRSERMESS
ncbi:uncharacterized protein J4E78_007081 [Alternaria triticimaculans]|uniref:uncharacterized protein n=1 Tax=Alternaria triticimaculans TaxID=297637 RepID=UPI0020C4F23C|nr:uncharacterized protein J4E78_007081 [Alternaria triticimaculans]KAI4654902.1 hypothetical protein J4E78_007081 [Alternaria triticimaculans]